MIPAFKYAAEARMLKAPAKVVLTLLNANEPTDISFAVMMVSSNGPC